MSRVKYQVSGVRCQVDKVVKLVSGGSILTGLGNPSSFTKLHLNQDIGCLLGRQGTSVQTGGSMIIS